MIAGRRDRKRSLIRSNATTAVRVRSVSSMDGVPAFEKGLSPEFGLSIPVSPFTRSASHPELMMYLRQLCALHAAGILTEEEFSAARGRLMGS
jgi:hypothetical protein